MAQHREGISPTSANPRNMLGRVPAIPNNMRSMYTNHIGSSPNKALCVRAFSTWRITDSTTCGLAEEERKIPSLLQIGTRVPTPCTFGGYSFRQWTGTTCEERNTPGYLGILALGWCYILSARLVEGQGEGTELTYTSSRAPQYHQSAENLLSWILVRLGGVSHGGGQPYWLLVQVGKPSSLGKKMESIWHLGRYHVKACTPSALNGREANQSLSIARLLLLHRPEKPSSS